MDEIIKEIWIEKQHYFEMIDRDKRLAIVEELMRISVSKAKKEMIKDFNIYSNHLCKSIDKYFEKFLKHQIAQRHRENIESLILGLTMKLKKRHLSTFQKEKQHNRNFIHIIINSGFDSGEN